MRHLTIDQRELKTRLLPLLRKRAFHVTSKAGYAGIESTGEILCQHDGIDLPNRHLRSPRSHGQKKGWVCFVNLRGVVEEHLLVGLGRYYFLNPENVEDNPHFLFLDDALKLTPWTHGREALRDLWVPYIEAWAPSPVEFRHVVECMTVTVTGNGWRRANTA